MIAFAYWFGWVVGATTATLICVSHYKNKMERTNLMPNKTKQLTVTDLKSAMNRIKSTAKFGMAGTADLEIAATCIGIVKRLVKIVDEVSFSTQFGSVVPPVEFKWNNEDAEWECFDALGHCRMSVEIQENCINSMAEIKRLLADTEKGGAE